MDDRVFQVIRLARNGQLWIVPFKFGSSRLRLRNATCLLSGVTHEAAYWFAKGLTCTVQPNGYTRSEGSPRMAPGRKGHWPLARAA